MENFDRAFLYTIQAKMNQYHQKDIQILINYLNL